MELFCFGDKYLIWIVLFNMWQCLRQIDSPIQLMSRRAWRSTKSSRFNRGMWFLSVITYLFICRKVWAAFFLIKNVNSKKGKDYVPLTLFHAHFKTYCCFNKIWYQYRKSGKHTHTSTDIFFSCLSNFFFLSSKYWRNVPLKFDIFSSIRARSRDFVWFLFFFSSISFSFETVILLLSVD